MTDASQGVFETLLARDGRVQALHRHLRRLRASAAELYGTAPAADLAATVRARAAGLMGSHRMRIDVVPDGDRLRVTVETTPLDPRRPHRYACVAVTVAGGHGPHKWRDRRALAPPAASGVAQAPPAASGVPLLVDEDGFVLEAAWANFWLLDGGVLSTPPADGRLLPGVTRARLLELAPSLGLEAVQRPISLAQARAAPVALLTSSLALAAGAALEAEPPATGEAAATVAAIRAALERDDWDD